MLKFFLLTYLLLTSFQAFSAQNARVIVPEAFVYADKKLKTPIAKIKRGKIVRVGSVIREHGRLLPIVISGRIAWMKVTDLSLDWIEGVNNLYDFNDVPKLTEHEVLQHEDLEDDPFGSNNILTFQGSKFSFDRLVGEDYDQNTSYDPLEGYSLSFSVEHRPPNKMLNWGVGVSYHYHSSEFQGITWPTLDGKLFFVPFVTGVAALDIFATMHLTGLLRMKFQLRDDTYKTSASAVGFSGGIQLRLLPTSKIGVLIGGAYQTIIFSQFESFEVNGTEQTIGLDYMTGPVFFAALTMGFGDNF